MTERNLQEQRKAHAEYKSNEYKELIETSERIISMLELVKKQFDEYKRLSTPALEERYVEHLKDNKDCKGH